MALEKKASLNDMAEVSETLQAAFDNLIKFVQFDIKTVTVPDEQIQQSAAREAAANPVLCGEDGMTSGLKSLLQQGAGDCRGKWLNLRGQFVSAIKPYKKKMDALKNIEANKAKIEKENCGIEGKILENARASLKYKEAEDAKNEADKHYDEIHSNVGGRPVTTFGGTKKYFALLFGITTVEWLVNYDSFFNWTGVPAIAAGFTVAMALIVAVAAHIHGEYLKQRNSRFGPHSESTASDFGILALVTFGLLAAIAVAGYARYSLAMHSIGAQGPIIQLGNLVPQQADPLIDVYFSLGINLIVWLIGLVVAFVSHDEDHVLMRAYKDKWHKTKEFSKLHKPIEKDIKKERAKLTHQQKQLVASADDQNQSTDKQRDMLERVEIAEKMFYEQIANQLQPVVDQYRIALGGELAKQDHQIQIGENLTTGLQYTQHSIQLKPDLLREFLS